MELDHCAALVTGAGSGLGAATVRALAGAGAYVFALDRVFPQETSADPRGTRRLVADVTDANAVSAAVEEISLGHAPLRVVVNCAGIAPSMRIVGVRGPHDTELFRRVVDVNLVGTFTVMAAAAELMSRNAPLDGWGQRGVVINTASVAAFEGQIGQAAYAASKGGVASMTIAAARDLARAGIRVCAVAPGLVETPMLATISEDYRVGLAASVPFPPRLARPEEYASLVLSIVGHDYLNGEVIRMDGGLRMGPR